MTHSKIIIISLLVLGVIIPIIDCWLYCKFVNKHGPQNEIWPGSGFYVWLKYLCK